MLSPVALHQFDRLQRLIVMRAVVRWLRSLPGMAMAALLALASVSLARTVVEGPFDPSGQPREVLLGALFIAHLGFVVAFAAHARAGFASGLVVRFPHAPLRAHASLLPLAVAHRVAVSGIALKALVAVALLDLAYGRLLTAVFPSAFDWFVHGVLLFSTLCVVGALVFARFRQSVLRAPRPLPRAQAAVGRGLVISLVAFYASYGALMVLIDRGPSALAELGVLLSRGALLLFPPLHAATAEGFLPALMWGMVMAAALVHLWQRMVAGSTRWVEEIPVDQHVAAATEPDRLSRLVLGRGLMAMASAFLAKDLVLPILRAPARYVTRQWLIFALTAGVLLSARFAFPAAQNQAAPVLLPLFAATFAALQTPAATLHLLGAEGRRIVLLLPALTPRTLFTIKAIPAMAFVLLHTLVDTALLLLVAALVGFRGIHVPAVLGTGAVAALAAALLGVSLGFLLPDFERGASGQDGATFAARGTFMMVSFCAVGVFGTLLALAGAGVLSARFLVSSSIALASLIGIAATVTGYIAVNRFGQMEIT